MPDPQALFRSTVIVDEGESLLNVDPQEHISTPGRRSGRKLSRTDQCPTTPTVSNECSQHRNDSELNRSLALLARKGLRHTRSPIDRKPHQPSLLTSEQIFTCKTTPGDVTGDTHRSIRMRSKVRDKMDGDR